MYRCRWHWSRSSDVGPANQHGASWGGWLQATRKPSATGNIHWHCTHHYQGNEHVYCFAITAGSYACSVERSHCTACVGAPFVLLASHFGCFQALSLSSQLPKSNCKLARQMSFLEARQNRIERGYLVVCSNRQMQSWFGTTVLVKVSCFSTASKEIWWLYFLKFPLKISQCKTWKETVNTAVWFL